VQVGSPVGEDADDLAQVPVSGGLGDAERLAMACDVGLVPELMRLFEDPQEYSPKILTWLFSTVRL
jgi:hypothetical protein